MRTTRLLAGSFLHVHLQVRMVFLLLLLTKRSKAVLDRHLLVMLLQMQGQLALLHLAFLIEPFLLLALYQCRIHHLMRKSL